LKWCEWERVFRLNLAKTRAQKLKRDIGVSEEPPIVPLEAFQTAIRSVAGDGSPLEMEVFIDKARWATIDSLVGFNYFDSNNVFAYYLKLLIMERKVSFDKETGFSEYKSLYDIITKNAQKSLGELK